MPNVPYTSEQFIQIMESNATLSGQYEEGAAALEEAAQTIIETSGDIMQEVVTNTTTQFQTLMQTLTAEFSGPFIVPNVVNAEGIVPTGTYANATYYNLEFGVKVAYGANGDIYLMMKGGTTTSYEYLHFIADTVPTGVTVETSDVTSSSSYVTGWPNFIQVGIIHGVTGRVNISLVMDTVDATYDYTNVKVTVTAA